LDPGPSGGALTPPPPSRVVPPTGATDSLEPIRPSGTSEPPPVGVAAATPTPSAKPVSAPSVTPVPLAHAKLAPAPVFAGFQWLRIETFRCGEVEQSVHVYLCEAFARYLLEGREETHPTAEFVLLPGKPSLLVARTEVSQKLYMEVMGRQGEFRDPLRFPSREVPITQVNYEEAKRFLGQVSAGLRLPTGDEWKRAARGGSSSSSYCCGSEKDLALYARYGAKRRPAALDQPGGVAERKPNAFGIFDMHGNVEEWTAEQEEREEGVSYSSSAPLRVLRGGSKSSSAFGVSLNHSHGFPEDSRGVLIGFRPVHSAR